GGHYRHIGRPPNGTGADVWLFASSKGNTVRTSSHADGDIGILIDDRSNGASRWADGSNDNNVSLGGFSNGLSGTLAFYANAVDIEGFSSGNHVDLGRIGALAAGAGGVTMNSTSQWTTTPPTTPAG